jgi:hypothetical protein
MVQGILSSSIENLRFVVFDLDKNLYFFPNEVEALVKDQNMAKLFKKTRATWIVWT